MVPEAGKTIELLSRHTTSSSTSGGRKSLGQKGKSHIFSTRGCRQVASSNNASKHKSHHSVCPAPAQAFEMRSPIKMNEWPLQIIL